jgi:hypothetical protein
MGMPMKRVSGNQFVFLACLIKRWACTASRICARSNIARPT